MKKSELKEFIKSSLLREDDDSKKGNKEEQERMEGAIRDDRDHVKNLEKDIKDNEDKLSKDDVSETTLNEDGDGKDYNEMMRDISNKMSELPREDHKDYLTKLGKFIEAKMKRLNEDELDEGMRGSTYEEDDTMREAEEVNVEDNEDINVDIEDEVDIDDESSKSEIEVDSELAGEDSDVAAILGLLTKAQSEAKALGDEKLMDQIGNTITYYTRQHVVAEMDLDVTGGEDDVAGVLDTESALNLQEIKRFKKLAGLIK